MGWVRVCNGTVGYATAQGYLGSVALFRTQGQSTTCNANQVCAVCIPATCYCFRPTVAVDPLDSGTHPHCHCFWPLGSSKSLQEIVAVPSE